MLLRRNFIVLMGVASMILASPLKRYISLENHELKKIRELINEDKQLDETLKLGWDSTSDFVDSGDLRKGPETFCILETYIEKRSIWLENITQISSGNDTLADGTSLKKRREDIQDIIILWSSLWHVYNTSVYYNELENLKKQFLNLSSEFIYTYEFDIGVRSLEITKKYLAIVERVNNSVYHVSYSLLNHYHDFALHLTWIVNFPHVLDSVIYINKTKERFEEQCVLMDRIDVDITFRDYIDPLIYITILSTGLVWNVLLLIMFARNKEIRTVPNIMIFNIAIGDVLNLIFNIPLQYFGYYYPQYLRLSVPVCTMFVSLRCMFTSASALSVVAMSAQKFLATLPSFHKLKAKSELSSLTVTVSYILLVWTASASIVLPDTLGGYVCDDKPIAKSGRKSAKIVSFHEFLIYCFVLPGSMLFFTLITARRLRQSAKDIPGSGCHQKYHEDARNRGAKVVTALCIVFSVSYVPFFLWGRIATVLNLDRFMIPYKVLDNITYYLLFSNPCFNPLALYVTSYNFRRLFNNYAFGWCYRRQSLQRTDTAIFYDTTSSTTNQQKSDI